MREEEMVVLRRSYLSECFCLVSPFFEFSGIRRKKKEKFRVLKNHLNFFCKTTDDFGTKKAHQKKRDMSANNNNTTAADRVEKKSIDEAIASFAMLVRCDLRFALLLFFLFLVFQRLLFFHSR
jgi:hypothetical protein